MALSDRSHRATRPDRLELIGLLLHVEPAPAETARVLEIGCAGGGNLLPMAAVLPGARFVGVDLDAGAIAAGRALAATVGLTNVELHAMDLADIGADLGVFDYIVAHRVYSFVPAATRDALLDVCAARLAPRGIAYLSHDVKPGWFSRQLAREVMQIGGGAGDVDRARAFLELVAHGAPSRESTYRATLAEELALVRQESDDVLAADYLAEVADGAWFEELAAALPRRGLTFLADADLASMAAVELASEALAVLDGLDGIVAREQYLDFLRNRKLRTTLICRDDAPLDRTLDGRQVAALCFASDAEADGDDLDAAARVTFQTRRSQITITDPVTKAALFLLRAAFPGTLRFTELLAGVEEKLGAPVNPAALASGVMQCFLCETVELALHPEPLVVAPADFPRATALARHAAAHGLPVASLRHEHVRLDDRERALLALLDGTRDAAALGELAPLLAQLGRKGLLCA